MQKKRFQYKSMMSLRVQFFCLLLCLYGGVSGLPVCGEENHEQFFVNSDIIPFEEEFEKLFRNFNASNTDQLEQFAQLLKSVDPYALEDAPRQEVENSNRIDFVVSLRCEVNAIVNSIKKIKSHFLQPDRIKRAGYPVEDHELTTDDGYILHLFRIPHGINSQQTNRTRPPVLLMHGLFDSSNCYIVLGRDNSLGIFTCDESEFTND